MLRQSRILLLRSTHSLWNLGRTCVLIVAFDSFNCFHNLKYPITEHIKIRSSYINRFHKFGSK
ncbi:unnamed protein product [Coffea canephora]|uniref:DH200=94 genomic scaffold, scaffold_7663 n=1 Tax=Coffea canephora TaxID=49390 RepID=A0A068VQ96_COFCA|nr:unnamed protein product [Coffea canephora]